MSHRVLRWARRRPLRHALRVDCQVVRERDFKLVSQLILDLSETGALLATRVPVLTGEPLIVSFRAPFTKTWIDVEATVQRVVHGRRKGDPGQALGIEFESIDPGSYRLLQNKLSGFPPPLPGRDHKESVWVPDRRLMS
jgi:PilZ domain